MSIAKNLAEQMGGSMWFESVDNEGSTFFMEFPLAISKDEEEGKQPEISVPEKVTKALPPMKNPDGRRQSAEHFVD